MPLWELILRKRPFVPVAIFLIGGIVLASFQQVNVLWCAAVGIAALLLTRWPPLRMAGVGLAILFLGAGIYSFRYEIRSANDLRVLLNGEPALATIRGELIETPAVRDFHSGTNEVEYSYATVRVEELELNGNWLPATGLVATRTRGALSEDYFENRHVEVYGVISYPARAAAPGLFDYRKYLHHSRIFFQVRSDSTNDWQLTSFEAMPVTERFRRWAKDQLAKGIPRQDESLEIIWAMTLARKQSMSGEMAEMFMRTGTMHIIAISGLHVTCIAFVFLFVVKWAGLSRAFGGVLVLGIVWFYTLATGLQSSAIRSALMTSVIVGSWTFKRPPNLLNSTAAAAVMILVVQPEQLFQAGFQLSFAVVAGIGLMLAWLDSFQLEVPIQFRFPLFSDPLLPAELRPRWQQWLDRPAGMLLGSIMISGASWIGSLPIVSYYFNMVTPVSLFANILAVPLSSLSLACSAGSLFLPPLSPILNKISWLSMWADIKFIGWCAELPGAYFYIPKADLPFFLFYTSALLIAFVPLLRQPRFRVFSLGGLVLLGNVWFGFTLAGSRETTLTVLPCAGTPAFVDFPGGSNDLLIDCSNARDSDYVLKRFLRGQGISSIPNLVLTHGDINHAGGFPLVREEFSPKNVFTSPARVLSRPYRDAIRWLEENPAQWRTVQAGDIVSNWRVLHPPSGRGFPRADDNSIVLSTRIHSWRVLHLSDLGALGQKRLLESGEDLRADIVIAGMPESGEPLTEELLEAIAPAVIILGTTRYPYTSLGKPELRERIERCGATVFYTSDDGGVTLRFSRSECQVSSMEGRQTVLH